MTTTIYIDANRNNCSVKSDDNKNEWTYRLANPVQIPAGSEISIQDSFIHKKGINGASIEIEEDIEEEMNFFYYLSDNPHFQPGSVYSNSQVGRVAPQAYQPTFYPAGSLFSSTSDKNDPNEGSGQKAPKSTDKPTCGRQGTEPNSWVYGMPSIAQRREFARYNASNQTIEACGGSANIQATTARPLRIMSDPYLMGYSEMPMMAVECGSLEGTSNTTFDIDEADRYISNVDDADIRFSDKKVYNANHTSPNALDVRAYNNLPPLFDATFTLPIKAPSSWRPLLHAGNANYHDRILRPKTGRVRIFIPKGVYSVNEIAQMIDDYMNGRTIASEVKANRNFSKDVNEVNLQNELYDGQLEVDNFSGEDTGSGVYSRVDTFRRYGTIEVDKPEYYSTMYPIGDVRNDPYAFSPLREMPSRLIDPTGTPIDLPGAGNNDDRVALSQFLFPSANQTMYVPVHRFRDIVNLCKYGRNSPKYGTMSDRVIAGSNFAHNAPDNRYESAVINRYAFQIESSTKGGIQTGLDSSDVNSLGFAHAQVEYGRVIGLHMKCDVSTYAEQLSGDVIPRADYNNRITDEGAIYPDNYNYNPQRKGYYVGTPDLSFSYDGNQSAFTINGLHQGCRIPSCDMRGNPMTDSGTQVAYLRRPAECYINNPDKQMIFDEKLPSSKANIEFNMVKAKKLVAGGSTPQTRIGGIAVHNWALETARRLGDVDFDEEVVNGNITGKVWGHKRFRGGTASSPNDYRQVYNFNDFFTTKEKAKTAWETTIWFRLGFSYESLCEEANYEVVNYYNMNKSDFAVARQAPRINMVDTNNKIQVINPSYFKMPGTTTNALLDLTSLPQISGTFNTKAFNAQLQQRYSFTDKDSQKGSGFTPGSRRGADTSKFASIHQGDTLVRTYDNTDINNNYMPYSQNYNIKDFFGSADSGYSSYRQIMYMDSSNADYGDSTENYGNSMYRANGLAVIETSGKQLVAQGLPALSKHGYFLITSDIVDETNDDVKQAQPLPLLGVVPISNLSNQDFITTKNTIVHTTNQAKVVNKIKIKILNPDLTSPILENNSSVILAITMPLPQNTPMESNQDDKENKQQDGKQEQPNPAEKKSK